MFIAGKIKCRGTAWSSTEIAVMNILVRCIGISKTYIRNRRLQDILLVIIHLTALAVPALLAQETQLHAGTACGRIEGITSGGQQMGERKSSARGSDTL